MKKVTLRVLMAVVSVVVMLVMLPLTACGPTEIRMNNLSVGVNPEVAVSVGNGNVSLVVGADGEINVTAKLIRPGNIEYEVSQDGDSVTVIAKTRSGSRVDVTLTVPANTDFDLSTGNGNVSAVGVEAPGEVSSGNGSVELEQIRGDVIGNTGNGNINVSDVHGSYILSDGNGSISISDATGSFLLNVGNGGITLREVVGSLIASSGNGNFSFSGELIPDSSNEVSVGNGNVIVELMGSPSVAIDLEIGNHGTIRCDLEVMVSQASKYQFIGTIGNGEADLEVRTGTGNITIR